MDYIQGNKLAWEESFDHRIPGWGEDNHSRLLQERLPFLCSDVITELEQIDFHGKTVAQFCCNNGRELLSLMQLGAESGVGFDIAENLLAQAAITAQKAGIHNCSFVACNLLEIPAEHYGRFDFIMFTIGAITWFRQLPELFAIVAKCLNPNGILLIHDFHPVMNMLPLPGEPDYDEHQIGKIAYSYFREEPWIENNGIGYIAGDFPSKTFTSFSHTLSAIINALSEVGIRLTKFQEYDYDIGLTDVYDSKGFPLSFLLLAKKD